MKTYKEFITELNKFEKFLVKKGLQSISKYPITKSVVKRFKDTTKKFRGDADNPFVSPRREAENILRKFQRSVPGQKGENLVRTSKGVEYYNPTQNRQIDMRGSSKQLNRKIEKGANLAGDKNTKGLVQNTRDQHSQIYKAPRFKFHPSDKKIDDLFIKNRLGAPTTENIPKGAVPEQSKKIDAKSVIKPLKRKKK